MNNDDLLEFNQATCARLLKISLQAFQRWGLKPTRREGRECFYRWSDCEEAAQRKRFARFPSMGEAPPAALEAHGENLLRLIFWHQCLALAESLGSMIACDSRDWCKRLGITDEQRSALVAYLATTIPQLVDIFVAHHHDTWFEATFGRDIDATAAALFSHDVEGGARPYGLLYQDYLAKQRAA